MPAALPGWWRRAATLAAALVVALPLGADELDIEYAEQQPLASKSLLLDVVQAGSRWVAVGERGHVLWSEDGAHWTQAETVPTRSTLTTVSAAGERLWAAGHDSVILTSGDHGRTWTRRYFAPERFQPIMDIRFFGEERGLAIGAYGLALVTNDGGHTWSDIVISEDEWHLNALLDLGEGRLMIAGEKGFSYRSEDGGETWETLEMPYPGSMFGILDGAEGCVLVVGLRGHAQETCDFGETWEEIETGTELTLSGGMRTGDRTVLVGNGGIVLESGASGAFVANTLTSGDDLAAIAATEEGRFVIVGEGGIHGYPEASGGQEERDE